jgi:hypothetical protein
VFCNGRKEIVEFLTKKWAKEDGYRLRKEVFAFAGNRIAVQVRHASFLFCASFGIDAAPHFFVLLSSGTNGTKSSRTAPSSGTVRMASRCGSLTFSHFLMDRSLTLL